MLTRWQKMTQPDKDSSLEDWKEWLAISHIHTPIEQGLGHYMTMCISVLGIQRFMNGDYSTALIVLGLTMALITIVNVGVNTSIKRRIEHQAIMRQLRQP